MFYDNIFDPYFFCIHVNIFSCFFVWINSNYLLLTFSDCFLYHIYSLPFPFSEYNIIIL